jgi:hypothetical protein
MQEKNENTSKLTATVLKEKDPLLSPQGTRGRDFGVLQRGGFLRLGEGGPSVKK